MSWRGLAGAWLAAGVLGVLAAGAGTAARGAVGFIGMLIFVAIAVAGRRFALTSVLVWLVLLGFLRRILIPFVGWSEQDPLLLVGPAAAMVLLFVSARNEPPPPRTAMAGCALVLSLLSVAEVFNPNQTSLGVAAQSLIFYLTPTLWLFVGTRLVHDERLRVLDVVLWTSVPVLALGLWQTFVDLLPFEYRWLGVSHQSPAIFIAGFRVRPFSTFASPQEYGYFLAFCIVIATARLLHRPKHPLVLTALLGTSFIALFLQSSRTVFVFLLLALTTMAIIRLRSIAVALFAMCIVGFVGLVMVQTDPGQSQLVIPDTSQQVVSTPGLPSNAVEHHESRVSALFTHEIEGLTNPTSGTGPVHVTLIVDGLQTGFSHPLGLGASHGTIASTKASGSDQAEQSLVASAENDVANAFSALGLLGGLTLLVLIALGVVGSIRLYRREPTAMHMAWVGMCIVALTQWLTGALYATSTILFLCLGSMARELAHDPPRPRVGPPSRPPRPPVAAEPPSPAPVGAPARPR